MYFAPFHELFPEIAQKETRTLTALNHPQLPRGDYALVEAYCNDVNCDCRRVMFNVLRRSTNTYVAVIAFGWESEAFYARWLGDNDSMEARELQGPILNWGSEQSDLAPVLLAEMKMVLSDEMYVDRLRRHYMMYKAAIAYQAIEPTRRAQIGKRVEKRAKRPKPTKIKKSRRQKKKK